MPRMSFEEMSRIPIPNDQKLKELILYISYVSEGDETFGAVKLNKLLFFSDFNAYLNLGKSITGHEYQALKNGPAPRALLPIEEQMLVNGEIAIRKEDHYGYTKNRTLALRPAQLDVFTADEIDIVNWTINQLKGKNASEVSDLSHKFIGWDIAEISETIPYSTVWLDRKEPTKGDKDHAKRLEALAKKYVAF